MPQQVAGKTGKFRVIVVDTSVVSEPLKPVPNQVVLDWLDQQLPETLFLTTVCLAELLAGVEALPAGRRRTKLHRALNDQMLPLFEGRILTFDKKAAEAFGRVSINTQAVGNSISFADAAIASIAIAHGFMLATRNERDFKGTGVTLINPWKAG